MLAKWWQCSLSPPWVGPSRPASDRRAGACGGVTPRLSEPGLAIAPLTRHEPTRQLDDPTSTRPRQEIPTVGAAKR